MERRREKRFSFQTPPTTVDRQPMRLVSTDKIIERLQQNFSVLENKGYTLLIVMLAWIRINQPGDSFNKHRAIHIIDY